MIAPFSREMFPDADTLSREVAERIAGKIREAATAGRPFVLGCATGTTPLGTYAYLIRFLADTPLDLSRFSTVNLDEYFPIARGDAQSYHTFMQTHVWGPLHAVQPSFDYRRHGYIPDGEAEDPEQEADRYEGLISRLGGVDLQILGIGTNGHIGFNEPGSPGDSATRVVKLAETTRRDNSVHFGGDIAKVPKRAITMGIRTILRAKEIYVLATGAPKAGIVEALVNSETPSPGIPASYLKKHHAVTIFLDRAAATRLE
jgi:glucosamine-6-phosphate deaminase